MDVGIAQVVAHAQAEVRDFGEQAADEGVACAGRVHGVDSVGVRPATFAVLVVDGRAVRAAGIDDVFDVPLEELRDAARGVAFAGDEGEFVVGDFDDAGQRQKFVHGGVEVSRVFPQRQAQVDVEGNGGTGGAEFVDGGTVRFAHRAGN